MRIALLVLSCPCAAWMMGCAASPVPDPRLAAEEYARAVAAGDVDAVYSLLSAESRRALSRKEVAQLLLSSKAELQARARRLAAPEAGVKAQGTVRFADGERAILALEDGDYRVHSAAALPAGASTPIELLAELRSVLARRSYAGLSRVLTKESRGELEERLRSLVSGLGQPEALQVEVDGDLAVVLVPGGHRIELRREDGQWKVQDFE